MATQHIDHLAISVLDNFYCEVPEILVTPYLKIVQVDAISDERYQMLWEEFKQRFTIEHPPKRLTRDKNDKYKSQDVLFAPLYVIAWYYSGNIIEPTKEHYDVIFAAKDSINDTLTALRILSKELIGRYPEQNMLNGLPEASLFRRFVFDNTSNYIPINAAEPYILSPENIHVLPTMVEQIRNLRSVSLRVAVSKIDLQQTRERVFDRILDTAIALESLYVPGNASEIKYRMGMRVATFLGDMSPSIREEMYELVQVIYEARSDIAHGNRSSIKELEEKVLKGTKWKTADELLAAMTALLRQSLKKVLLEVGERKFMASPGFHKALDLAGIRAEAFQLPL